MLLLLHSVGENFHKTILDTKGEEINVELGYERESCHTLSKEIHGGCFEMIAVSLSPQLIGIS